MMDMPSVSDDPDEGLRRAFNDLVEQDPENKEELRRLADMGCTDAMVRLGVMLVDGGGGEGQALELFARAAEAGNSMGMRNMGYCHALGLCTERNKAKAVEWYRRAAEAGNAKAQCNLGVMYEHGNGVEADQEEAVRWFRLSAENGYSRGRTNYGVHLLEGIGIDRDPAAAAEQFRLSGSPRANYRLGRMYLDGVGVGRDIRKGTELLETSSSEGYAKAMFLLGSIIEEGSPQRSLDLYLQAASRGNRDAMDRLTDLGIEVPERAPRMKRRRKE